MEKKIKEKIILILTGHTAYEIAGYVYLITGQMPSSSVSENINKIIDYLENGYLGRGWSDAKDRLKESQHFLVTFDPYNEGGLRVCDNCGKIICEGYILGGDEYACSDECAIDLYGGDIETFHQELEDADTDYGETYWTEW